MSFIWINLVFWIKWFIVYRIRRSINKSYFRTSPKITFWKEMVSTFWKFYSSYYCICLLFWKVWCKMINLKILEMIFQKMSTYFNFCSLKYTFILSQEKFLLFSSKSVWLHTKSMYCRENFESSALIKFYFVGLGVNFSWTATE